MSSFHGDSNPLLDESKPAWLQSPRSILGWFVVMAVMFSINHACAVACVGIASIALPGELAGTSTGTLWMTYTFSALFTAIFVVDRLGPKKTLVTGLFLYCFYVASYLLASLVSALAWPGAIIGATVSGVGAGWLWTAQGVYFARAAKWYAMAKQQSVGESTSFFAGIFAAIYVGSEVVFRLLWKLSSLGEPSNPCVPAAAGFNAGQVVVFIIYTAAALAAAIGMMFVREFPDPDAGATGAPPETKSMVQQFTAKVCSAGKLLVSDPRMGLIAGLNVTFGLGAAYVNHYFNGFVANNAVGSANVSFLEALIPGTAAVLSLPYGWATRRCVGKKWMMVWGCVNYILAILACLIIPQLSPDSDAGLTFWLILVYLIFGSARAIYEGINKAVFADFFPDQKQGAFANMVLQNGGIASVAFFIWGWVLESKVFPEQCPAGSGGDYLAELEKELQAAQTADNQGDCSRLNGLISDCEKGHKEIDPSVMEYVILAVAALSIVGILLAFKKHERMQRATETNGKYTPPGDL